MHAPVQLNKMNIVTVWPFQILKQTCNLKQYHICVLLENFHENLHWLSPLKKCLFDVNNMARATCESTFLYSKYPIQKF